MREGESEGREKNKGGMEEVGGRGGREGAG